MNTSGWEPMDQRVLVLPDVVDEKVGNIFLPQQHQEREQFAQIKGTIVAIGANAWAEAKATSQAFVPPALGERVLIAKYGGIIFDGDDGQKYRILNDVDVTARKQREAA